MYMCLYILHVLSLVGIAITYTFRTRDSFRSHYPMLQMEDCGHICGSSTGNAITCICTNVILSQYTLSMAGARV